MNLSRFVRRDLDIGLIAAICLGLSGGIIALYSASYNWDSGLPSDIYEKQITWALLGGVALVIAMVIPIKVYYAFAYIFYGLAVVFLILVLKCATSVGSPWAPFTSSPPNWRRSRLSWHSRAICAIKTAT